MLDMPEELPALHEATAAQVAPKAVAPQRPPLLASEELLKGHKAIEISHHGVLYRLQATRLGKLILTK